MDVLDLFMYELYNVYTFYVSFYSSVHRDVKCVEELYKRMLNY